jgi:hypothetical protein
MSTQTLYVRDEKLWAKAKRFAGDEGLSGVVHELLRTWIKRKEAEMDSFRRSGEMHEHELFVGPQAHELEARVVFTGRLLVDSVGFSVGQVPRVQVFETKARQLLVHRTWNDTSGSDQGATYQVYGGYEQLMRDRSALNTMWLDGDPERDRDADYSDQFEQQLASALGKEMIIRID